MTVNLLDVGSGFKRTAINSNFTTIESELNNNVLTKDGGTQLEADLDFNSNKAINIANGINNTDAVNVQQLNGAISAAGSGLIASQQETQKGSAASGQVFTFAGISYTVGGNNLYVFQNGQKLTKDRDYTETSSTSITINAARTINANDDFDFITNIATTTSVSNTSAITHTESGTDYNLATYLQNRHVVYMSDYEMAGDGVTNDTTNFLAAIAATPTNGVLKAQPGKNYYFGTVAGDTTVATIAKNITIDWQGSKITVDGDNTSVWTGSGFVKFQDTNGGMKNFIFEDTTFDIVNGPSRGVSPIQIRSEAASDTGFTFSNYHVVKGNSLLQVTTSDASLYRATGIALEGAVTAGDVYYGVNLASNGDFVTGSYSVDRCVRLLYVYQAKGVKLKGYCETGRPTSGAVNISNLSNLDTVPTEDCDFDMSFGTVDGPLLFNLNNTGGVAGDDGKGVIRDVKVKFRAKTLGSNILGLSAPVIFRDYDTAGSAVTGATGIMDGLTLDIELPTDLANPIVNNCDSPNFGTLALNPANFTAENTALGSFTLDKGYNKIFNVRKGTFATPITIPLLYLFPKMSNQLLRVRLSIATSEDTAFSGQKSAISVVDLLGDISGAGVTTIRQQATATQTTTGGIAPTFTIADVTGVGLSITVVGYTNGANNIVSVTAENLA